MTSHEREQKAKQIAEQHYGRERIGFADGPIAKIGTPRHWPTSGTVETVAVPLVHPTRDGLVIGDVIVDFDGDVVTHRLAVAV